MVRTATPKDSGSGAPVETEALIAASKQPALGQQADRALGPLARKLRDARDAARERGGDEQAVKALGAALRRVRAEITRRSEAEPDEAADQDKAAPAGAGAGAKAKGARSPRSPGIRAGRPGARKMPKPPAAVAGAEPAADPATGAVRAPRMIRTGAAVPAPGPEAPRTAVMTPPPARKARGGPATEDRTERKARKEAEKAERKRVKDAEKAEEKAARKLKKDAEKAERKARKPGRDAPEV